MPHIYRSETLQNTARRGRRAMRLTSEQRPNPDWPQAATDMIADILHGLNSRVELAEFQTRHAEGHHLMGIDAVLYRARRTYESDFEEEIDS